MASTTFQRGGTHTALVPQRWSKADYKFAFAANPYLPFMSAKDGAIIQVKKDFTKEKGDKLTFGLRGLLQGSGETDDGNYEDNEQAMSFYDMSVQIHERGTSTLLSGNMTEQAAYTNLRPKGRAAIREWSGRVQARDITDALSGMVSKSFAGQITGANATDSSSVQIATVNQVSLTKSATALRWFGGGQNSSGVIERVANDAAIDSTSTNLFGTKVIEYVKRMAKKTIDASGNPVSPIRPVYVDGAPYFVFYIDELQMKQLRADTDWKNAQKDANLRGKTNPLFSGMAGIWDGVVIKPIELLHKRLGAGGVTAPEYFDTTSDACASGITVCRALFCGAQAACFAWGKMPVWKDGYKDWQRTKWGTHTDMIYGVKKSVFATGAGSANVEFGCVCVDTAVIAD